LFQPFRLEKPPGSTGVMVQPKQGRCQSPPV
jgi:hypothetical protein